MDIVDKIQVGGIVYSISLGSNLTSEQQAQIRQNIGVAPAEETVNFSVEGQTLILTKGVNR